MSLTRHIPNTITCLNLLSGMLAIVAAFHADTEFWGLDGVYWCYIFIGAAALFDFLDGAAARLLRAYSELGKQLDSLSDAVSFGVAPSMLVFNTMLASGAGLGWSLTALATAIAGVIRLGRFNIDTRQTTSFIGLPIPSNAIFWVGVVAWIHGHGYPGTPAMVVLTGVMAWLMNCNLRMFSLKFKNFSVRENFRRYVILFAAILFVVTEGLAGLAWTIILYIVISLFGRRVEA